MQIHDRICPDAVLLNREPLTLGNEETTAFYADKTVLVTGGGGSVGSELCRRLAECGVGTLIILDIYENNAFELQQELLSLYGETVSVIVEIASVRDAERLECIFEHYRPEIVFHAAAHKHVPLMEHSPCEAVKNNVFGTRNTADAAEKYGVKKFVLISTDKAVNPTNVMGATKRLCEMVVLSRRDSGTDFTAVRFGNVLGSHGSVIPLFQRQILRGGPLTLTDKRAVRYFMTVAEASGLVMQAGAMAQKGELFVLDMGEPVRVYDLAINMIRLFDLEPGRDIEIKEIGLRPGEKLYEELLVRTDELQRTENEKIFIECDVSPSREEVEKGLARLHRAVNDSGRELVSAGVREMLKELVPTFCEAELVNRSFDGTCSRIVN